ncbi:MAG TPA: hypothetical protein VIF60_19610 [Burkholderiaceae bacterium]|jgi:hypothetical protein
MSTRKFIFILILALTYPAIFYLAAALPLNVVGISPHTALIGFLAWVMYWLGLVLPVHVLSEQGRKWHPALSVLGSYIGSATCFVLASWHPRMYTLRVGDSIFVQNGEATPLYYRELTIEVIMFGVAVAIGLPLFLKLTKK